MVSQSKGAIDIFKNSEQHWFILAYIEPDFIVYDFYKRIIR
jgi:hypothetical protein